MLIGVVADDFTGAGDIALALAKGRSGEGGLRTTQYFGVPDGSAGSGVEAGVISLKSRSLAAPDAVAQSLAAVDWLLAQGARQIVFKYCSTFDSTERGNIGPVAEVLAERLGVDKVLFCPTFPENGRTVFQGNLFVHDVPLSESGMAHHPLTPMRDSDIRRVLAAQTSRAVGHVEYSTVLDGPGSIRRAVEASDASFLVVDAITTGDLLAITEAAAGMRLITGASGLGAGLAENFIHGGGAARSALPRIPTEGPAIVLAGSCSRATLGQIAHHQAAHPSRAIDVEALMRGHDDREGHLRFLLENGEREPLLHSSADPATLADLQSRYGAESLADRLDALFGDLAREAVARGVRRVVVAGGETSGAVASALGRSFGNGGGVALRVGTEIDPGVPILVIEGDAPVGLALKSGNFGSVDFFEKALSKMEHGG